MINLIRNNNPFTVLILFIFALLIKMQVLLNPVAPVPMPEVPAFNLLLEWMDHIFNRSAFAYTLLAFLMIFAQGLFLNAITSKHKIFNRIDFTPTFYYVLLTSVLPAFNHFTTILFVNWFLIFSFDVILSFTQPLHPRKHIFNAGFLIAVCSLFAFPTIFFLLLLLIALLMLRAFNLAELVVAFLGALMVYYFFVALLYLTDHINTLDEWIHIGFSKPARPKHVAYLISMVSGIVLLLLSGLYATQMQMYKSTIYIRRSWGVLIAGLFISVLIVFLCPVFGDEAWALTLPLLSLIAAQPLYLEKNRRFSNFIFYFSIALVVFCQFTINRYSL